MKSEDIMHRPSIQREVLNYLGSDIIKLIQDTAAEMNCTTDEVTISITDNIDGTFIEVTSNKLVEGDHHD